jgi:chromosome segregation ATPase
MTDREKKIAEIRQGYKSDKNDNSFTYKKEIVERDIQFLLSELERIQHEWISPDTARKLIDDIADKNEQLDREREENRKLRDHNSVLLNDYDNVVVDRNEWERRNQTLLEENRKLREERAHFERCMELFCDFIDVKKDASIEQMANAFIYKLQTAQSEIERLKQENQDLADKYNDTVYGLESLVESLQQQLDAAKQENERLKEQRDGYYANAKYTEAAFTEVTKLRSLLKQAEEALEWYANEKHWITAYYHSEFGRANVKAMYQKEPWLKAQNTLSLIRGEANKEDTK